MFRKRHISELERALRDKGINVKIGPGALFFSILSQCGYNDAYDGDNFNIDVYCDDYSHVSLSDYISIMKCHITAAHDGRLAATVYPIYGMNDDRTMRPFFDNGGIMWNIFTFSPHSALKDSYECVSKYNLDGKLLNV